MLKYTVELDIDRPREEVAELYEDREQLIKWQKGLQSVEHLAGEPGQVGAKSRLTFQIDGRTMVMTETILVRDPPERFERLYETAGVTNTVRHRLVRLEDDRTKWISENEFHFRGWMRVVGWLMKGAFPKQSLAYLEAFKALAERGVDVRDQQ